MGKSSKSKGRAMLVGAAVCWGLAGVCVKSITWNAFPIIAIRNLISLLLMSAVRRKAEIHFTGINILGMVVTSATGMLYLTALKFTTAGTTIVLQYVAPILVFLYSVIFQHRRARLCEILITLAVFGGIILSFADSIVSDSPMPYALLGDFLALASGFTFAAQIIIMNRKNVNSEEVQIMGNGLSFLIACPFLFFDKSVSFDLTNIIWLAILSVFQYGLANILFTRGVKYVDKIEASLILTIEPIFNPIPVAFINGERMGALAIIGSVTVIAFVTLYGLLPTLEKKRRKQ